MLKDVCEVLDLRVDNVKNRLDQQDHCSTGVLASDGKRYQTTIVNESGLYDVIFQSRKPEAKRFRRWVTNEVLPAIRKTGAYISDSIMEADDPWELLEIANHRDAVERVDSRDKGVATTDTLGKTAGHNG